MKRFCLLLLVVGLLAGAAAAQASSKTRRAPRPAAGQPVVNDAEAGEQLGKRLQQVLNAWSTMDPDNAAKYYAKDADLVYFDLMPLQYKGWDEYYLGTKKLFANYQELSIRLREDAQVHWKGELAYATAIWDVFATLADGSKQQLALRWTVVLERRNGDWLVVHEHVSAPLPEPAPAKPKPPPPAAQPAEPEKKPDPYR
jgi:uncharacterized protein (TIGR02246 family)